VEGDGAEKQEHDADGGKRGQQRGDVSDAWHHEADCREHLDDPDAASHRSADVLCPRGTGLQSWERHQHVKGARGEEERREQRLQDPERDIHVTRSPRFTASVRMAALIGP
jgi:hypothetical protein